MGECMRPKRKNEIFEDLKEEVSNFYNTASELEDRVDSQEQHTPRNCLPTHIIDESKIRSSHQRCSIKKGVFRNFEKFTRKYLCQSLFFNKVAGIRPESLY